MSEREQELLIRMSEAIPKLNDGNKKYLLGVADGVALVTGQKEGVYSENGGDNDNSGDSVTG